MNSSIYYMGKIASYNEIGFPYEMVKQALVADGLSIPVATELLKAAGWTSAVGRGLGWMGRKLTAGAGGLTRRAATSTAKPGMVSKGTNAVAGNMSSMGDAFSNAGQSITQNPGESFLGGIKGFGKGLNPFGQGQGLGAGMGKAVGAGTMGYGAYSMMRPRPRPQQYAQRN